MNKEIDTPVFETWQKALSPEANLPVITTSALIDLKELEDFIAQIKQDKAESIRIHLLRFNWNQDEPQGKKKADGKIPPGCEWQIVDGNKTQVAVAISGATKINVNADYVTDAKDIVKNGKIRLLIPGGEKEGPTGHNPPSKPAPTGT